MGIAVIGIGAGGHARVLLEALRLDGGYDAVVLVDADRARWDTVVDDVPVAAGGDDAIADVAARHQTRAFFIGVGSVDAKGAALRRRLFERALAAGLTPVTIVHPRAVVSSRATLGRGAQVLALAVVGTGAAVDDNAIVNTTAVVEHDCRIGAHAHVATGAKLASGVIVGACAHIGVGVSVRQLARIGEGAVVGAGAVVVGDVAAGAVVAGVPARSLRRRGGDGGGA